MGTLYKKVKDHFSPRKEKSKDVNNIKKIKIKLKFPVKGEIMKSTRKLCFVNRRATLDLSEDYVSNYLRKLEKLKQFYLSRRASGTTKLNVEATKLINNTHILKKKMKVKEAQNSKFVETSFNKYKLRKCFVSLERLQLNSDLSIVKTSTDTIKTNTPKKIINKLEVLQSRPFSTEILKSNILPNSKSEINKTITKNVLGHNKVPVEEVIKREGVKNIFKKKLESQTKCISKKMPSNHNRIKTLENINKMKHSKCIKKSISKDYSIDLDKKKICVKNEKYNHKSFKTNLIDVCRSSTHLNKIDSTQSIFKISNFNESYHDMIDNKLHKINKKNRMLRNTRKENEHYGEENCKDSKILNSRDNIDFVINNKKRSQINNFGMKIETELVSIKYTCNEKKGGNTHDINSFTNMNHVSNNISKQINYPSMENSSMAKSLVSNIDTLHKNAEYMKMGNKTLHRKRNCSKHTKLKNKTEANMMNYSNEIKNKVDYNKRNNAKLNEIEMKTCDNTRNNSEQIKINKKTQINKLDNSKHMKIEKQTQHKKSNHHYDERETKDRKSHNLEYKQIKKEMQFSKSDTTEHKTISSKPNNSQQEELVTKARKVKHRKQYNKKNNSEQIKRDREMQNNKSNNTELLEIGKNTYYNKSINFKHLEIEQKKQDNKINYSNRQEIENKTQDKKSNNLEHRKIKKEIQASKRKSSEHITTSNKSNNCEHKKIETKVQDSTCKSFLEHMELERKTQDKINLSHCQKIEIKSQGEKTNNLEHVKIKIASKRHNPEHTKVDSKSKHKEIEMKTQVKKKKSKLMEIEIKTLDNKSINSQHKEIELKMQDIKGDNSYFKEIENNIQDNKNKNLKHLEIIQKTREKRNNSHHHDIGRKAQDTKSNKSKHANTKNEINSSKRDNSENMTVNSKSNNSQHKEIETKAEDNKSNSEYLEIEMKTRNNYKKNLENMKIEKKSNNSHLEQNKKTQNIKRRHPKYKVLERKAQDNMTNNFEHTSIKQKIQDNKNNISEHMEIENKLQGDMKIRLCKCNKQLQVHYSDAFCEIPLVIETNVINNTEESQIISNNNKQSLFCSASKPLKIPKVSHCKTNERRKRMKLTTIQFLDGTVDSMSSSSDESVDTVKPEVNSDVKRQTPLKKQHPSTNTGTPTRRYERLNIQIKKSPKTDKSAGTATDDCKVNSAIVKLVRNKDIEQMLGIEKPVLQSPSMPENRNLGDLTFKKVIDKSVTGISDNTKMKERHVSHPTEQKSKFSTFKTSKRVSPLVSFTREKKNLRVANPSSDKETASCSGENNPLITSILLSNESETALSKLDQKSVNIVIDKQFVTCVNSVFSSSHELLRPLEETTAVENSNIHRLIKQIKNKEDLELNTPLRKCDRSLPTENNSFAELRVCLRRLSPHLTGKCIYLIQFSCFNLNLRD